MVYRKFLVPCLVVLCQVTATAQSYPHFLEKFSTREGMSSNNITDIVQDDQGFLWIATTDGLNRFDGTERVQFFHHENTNSIPHNYIYCLEKMPGNLIAIGTQSGISFLNPSSGQFHNFYFNSNSNLDEYNNTVGDLVTDAHGNLWAQANNALFVFDQHGKHLKTILSPFTEKDARSRRLRFVERLYPLSSGHMLAWRFDGWHVYAPRTFISQPLQATPYNNPLLQEMDARFKSGERYYPRANVFSIPGNFFMAILPSRDSVVLMDEKGKQYDRAYFPFNNYPFILWSQKMVAVDSSRLLFLFHNFGLAQIDLQWDKGRPSFRKISPLLYGDLEFVAAIADRQNNWWLATSVDGLRRISPHKQNFKSDSIPTFHFEVNSIVKEGSTLWVGTYGSGLFQKLPSGKIIQHFLSDTEKDPWPNFIWNIRQVNSDTLWVGTQVGMYWYCPSKRTKGKLTYRDRPTAIDSIAITTQITDSYGLTWMGLGAGKGVCYFNNHTKKFVHYPVDEKSYPLRYPTQIEEDSHGNLWFVSDASPSLVRWTRSTNRFDVVQLPGFKKLSSLTALRIESDSVFWVGSVANGLFRFNPIKNTIRIYGHDHGIGDSHVYSIYLDHSKRVWLATTGSLSCYDPRTEIFTNYHSQDGLPVEFPTANFFYDAQEKMLYNGGHGAFFRFDPDQVELTQSPQKIMITEMEVNGRPFLFAGKEARFRPRENDIIIRYTSIDLSNGPATRYAYKLLGEDTSWMMAGHQRQINFSNLAPGHYTFMVRAGNARGEWSSEIATVSFTIRKPFTQTAAFYALIVLAMAGLFYALYRFRVRQLMRLEQVRSEISRNLHDEVGSTLTNISLGTLLAQKEAQNEPSLNRILERIYQDSQQVSQAMREIVWSINPEIDTLEEALPRMLQYASQLLEAKNMELQAEIAPGIGNVRLSMQSRRDLYLIFKETVNNLARHSKATVVKVRVDFVKDELIMVISDNGVGFNTKATLHNGIRNMRERAMNHGWNLDVRSQPGEGTTLELKANVS